METSKKTADAILRAYGDDHPYILDWYACAKDIPPNYDDLIIPEIERATEKILGSHIKSKIYNYIIHRYSDNKLSGTMDSVRIYSNGKVKTISYEMDKNFTSVKIKVIAIKE